MKKILPILFIFFCLKSYSQFATKAYVDSMFHTLDSVIVKKPKTTITNTTILLDTLTIPNNTKFSFQILVQTDSDNTIKIVYVRNINGIYAIIDDSDVKSFSHNRSGGIFNSTIKYQITSSIINGKVIISAIGQKNTIINWTLSRSIL